MEFTTFTEFLIHRLEASSRGARTYARELGFIHRVCESYSYCFIHVFLVHRLCQMFTEFSEGDFLVSMPCVKFAKIVQVSINYDIYELLIHRLLVIHRV